MNFKIEIYFRKSYEYIFLNRLHPSSKATPINLAIRCARLRILVIGLRRSVVGALD